MATSRVIACERCGQALNVPSNRPGFATCPMCKHRMFCNVSPSQKVASPSPKTKHPKCTAHTPKHHKTSAKWYRGPLTLASFACIAMVSAVLWQEGFFKRDPNALPRSLMKSISSLNKASRSAHTPQKTGSGVFPTPVTKAFCDLLSDAELNSEPVDPFSHVDPQSLVTSKTNPTHLAASVSAYQQHDLDSAIDHAWFAYEENKSNELIATIQNLSAEAALAASYGKDFIQALAYLVQLKAENLGERYVATWSTVITQHLQTLGLSDKGHIQDTALFANILLTYADAAQQSGSKLGLQTVQCTYARVLEQHGLKALQANKITPGLGILSAAESHIPDDPDLQASTNIALHSYALELFNKGRREKAIASMQRLLNRDNNPANQEARCHMAQMMASQAMELAYKFRFDDARKLFGKAQAECEIEESDAQLAYIELINAEWHLKRGETQQANHKLINMQRYKADPSTEQWASAFYNDLDKIEARNRKINQARQWSPSKIPDITASLCGEIDESTGQCKTIHFFRDSMFLGIADPEMRLLELEHKGVSMELRDIDNEGRFDSIDVAQGMNRRRVIESDGDNLLDAEFLFNTKGEVVSSERYSGRVKIQLPGSAIARSHDTFSASDAYLAVHKNGRLIGNTETVENDQFPGWKTVFVEDFKYGDGLFIRMMDDDSVSDKFAQGASKFANAIGGIFGVEKRANWRDPDDHIDDFYIRSYPETRIYHGEKGEASIHLISKPTNLPRGTYWSESSEVVNIFRYGNFSDYEDQGLTEEIVKKARSAEEKSSGMVTLASWTVPEIAVWILMAEARLAYQLTAGFVGTAIMEEQLSRKSDL